MVEPSEVPDEPKRNWGSIKFVGGMGVGILVFWVGLRAAGYTVARSMATGQELAQVKDVLPASYRLKVTLGDVVVKMVQQGAIDKSKFLQLYSQRESLSDVQKRLLETPSDDEVVVTQENAGVLLNLLWPLGIANKSRILSEGVMGTQYKGREGSFASTGGWTLGARDGGQLFNSMSLLELSSEQEARVEEIAANIYRPCCGNSTAFPDCNHGAAMLGYIELAVAQGVPSEEIYKGALALNSYWFPQTYTGLATYFKLKKNTAWRKVNAREVLGASYSSGQGYAEISKQLQADSLLPNVGGGGGCGV